MMINDENKKSLSRMLKGRALYLALGVCVLAAGFVSYSVSRGAKTPLNSGTASEAERSTYVHINERVLPGDYAAQPEDITQPAETQPAQTEPAPSAEAVFENAAEPVQSAAPEADALYFTLPVTAPTGKLFSMGVPVFSSTMNDYRTHNGVDLSAPAGTPVNAVARGTVTRVAGDSLFGNTVTVDHGGGVVSVISGLADEGLIAEGARVDNDTALGVVGALPVEAADGSHIHLEIRVDGALRDPLEFLGLAGDETD